MLTMTSLNPPRSLVEKSETSNRQPLRFAVFAIHLVQVAREQRGLFAAGAGADFQEERIDRVVLGGDELVLQGFQKLAGLCLGLGELGFGKLGHLGVAAGGHFAQFAKLF